MFEVACRFLLDYFMLTMLFSHIYFLLLLFMVMCVYIYIGERCGSILLDISQRVIRKVGREGGGRGVCSSSHYLTFRRKSSSHSHTPDEFYITELFFPLRMYHKLSRQYLTKYTHVTHSSPQQEMESSLFRKISCASPFPRFPFTIT